MICAGPDPSLFELRSSTPDVCTIDPNGCANRGCANADYVPAIANIVASGTCQPDLEAPTLNHGAGLKKSFSLHIEAS
jgi:hypothetical protein